MIHVALNEDDFEFHLKLEEIVDDLCDVYAISDATIYENEALLSKVRQYVQDIITYDELIEWFEELHETPTLLEESDTE
jgi:hypothetical protein